MGKRLKAPFLAENGLGCGDWIIKCLDVSIRSFFIWACRPQRIKTTGLSLLFKTSIIRIIDVLNKRDKPVVFILWGRHAQMKKERIDTSKHFIIQSPHPSPFSARNGALRRFPMKKAF